MDTGRGPLDRWTRREATDAAVFGSLALLAAVLPITIAGANIALGLLAAALLLRRLQGRSDSGEPVWWRRPVFGAFVLYAAVGVLASLFGVSPADSVRDWHKDLHKVAVVALLMMALPSLSAEKRGLLPRFLALGFCAAAAIGVGQTVWSAARGLGFVRAHAFVHPVAFGDMMALGALGGAAFLFSPAEGVRPRDRPYLLALLALALPALLLSGTRGAVAGLAAGALALAFPERASWVVERRRAGKLLIAGALSAAVAAAAVALRKESLSARSASTSAGIHQVLWTVGLKIFRDHPLLGVGPGNYLKVFPLYWREPLDDQIDWASAHNMYIQALAERGIAGLAALLLVLGTLLASARRAFLERRSATSLWAFAAVVGFGVLNFTETAFQHEQTMTLLLFLWALGQTA